MKVIDFVIVGIICGICGVIIWKMIVQKKNGKAGKCDGNCAGCSVHCRKEK